MRIEPVVVFVVAALAALWPFIAAQSADDRLRVRYLMLGYGALAVGAVLAVVLEPGPFRWAWVVLTVAMLVRLALVPRLARRQTRPT